MTTTRLPSGETRGAVKSNPGADSRARRSPVPVSMTTTSLRSPPAPSSTDHPVTAARPSGVSSNACSSRARPGWGVRSRGAGTAPAVTSPEAPGPLQASSPASTSWTRSRCSSGPRSWSQYRTRADSCRIAVTPASARARRCCASATAPLAPGSTDAVNAASPEPVAVASRLIPPGGAMIRRASPPAAGSSHRARWPSGSPAGPSPGPGGGPGAAGGSAPPDSGLPGSGLSCPGRAASGRGGGPAGRVPGGAGRDDRKASEPSGRNAGLSSPSADRVSRTAAGAASLVSTRQMLDLNVWPSGARADTVTASQLPSGASRSPVSRGRAR